MKICVTGAFGYVGSLLTSELVNYYDEIVLFDVAVKEILLMNLPKGPKYTIIQGDTRSKKDVRKALDGVDAVVDLAGLTNVSKSFEMKNLVKSINYGGFKNLVREAIKAKVKDYIYISSCSVYGTTTGIVDETYKGNPESPYGMYKLKCDEFLMNVKDEINVTSLRLGTVYGYAVGMRFDTIINKFIYQSCIQQPLTIHKGALDLKRPYIHVKDVVRAILFALEHPEMRGQIYNVVDQNISVKNIVELIKKYIQDVEVKFIKTNVSNQLSFEVSSSKISNLGFKPGYTLKKGIKELISKFDSLKDK